MGMAGWQFAFAAPDIEEEEGMQGIEVSVTDCWHADETAQGSILLALMHDLSMLVRRPAGGFASSWSETLQEPPTIGTAEEAWGSGMKWISVLLSLLAMDWKYCALFSGGSVFHLGLVVMSVVCAFKLEAHDRLWWWVME
jgi:hypothetical protein